MGSIPKPSPDWKCCLSWLVVFKPTDTYYPEKDGKRKKSKTTNQLLYLQQLFNFHLISDGTPMDQTSPAGDDFPMYRQASFLFAVIGLGKAG